MMCKDFHSVSPYQFHVPSSSSLLVVALKPKEKDEFRTAAMLLQFYEILS
jgi:hypothetical protein